MTEGGAGCERPQGGFDRDGQAMKTSSLTRYRITSVANRCDRPPGLLRCRASGAAVEEHIQCGREDSRHAIRQKVVL